MLYTRSGPNQTATITATDGLSRIEKGYGIYRKDDGDDSLDLVAVVDTQTLADAILQRLEPSTEPEPGKYAIPFTAQQIEELESLTFGVFELEYDAGGEICIPRRHWMLLAYAAVGKARALHQGRDEHIWASELMQIHSGIMFNFRPGDGRV